MRANLKVNWGVMYSNDVSLCTFDLQVIQVQERQRRCTAMYGLIASYIFRAQL